MNGGKIEQVLGLDEQIKQLSEQFAEKEHALFLGRGTHYPIAMEGALKLKEISYIHAESYPAGELKHGPLALFFFTDGFAPMESLIILAFDQNHQRHYRAGDKTQKKQRETPAHSFEKFHQIKPSNQQAISSRNPAGYGSAVDTERVESNLGDRLPHGGQGGVGMLRQRDIVKTGDGDIASNDKTLFLGGADSA